MSMMSGYPPISSNNFQKIPAYYNTPYSGSYSRQNLPAYSKNNTYAGYARPETEAKLSIMYVNDLHGILYQSNIFSNVVKWFNNTFGKDRDVDTLKLAGGDITIGSNKKKNSLWMQLMDRLGLDFSAVGNHEFDAETKGFAEELVNLQKCKYLTSNLDISPTSPLFQRKMEGKIAESAIKIINGHKYGIIGASPVDLEDHCPKSKLDGVKITSNFDATLERIRQQIKKLQDQGVNKIILVSHLGNEREKEVAKRVSGIDIIIGGHSHDLIQGIVPEKNLFMSPTNEPVILVQAGANGDHFGVLNIIFDSNGRIKSGTNAIESTAKWQEDPSLEAIKDNSLGRSESLGFLTSPCMPPQDPLKSENPIASFVADGMRYKSGADIAIINAGNVRGRLDKGPITRRRLEDIIPFSNKLMKVSLSEKDIIDALNLGAKSLHNEGDDKLGVLQVSGLRYTVTPSLTVKDVFLERPNGSFERLNHVSPNSSKKFTAIYDDYLYQGKLGLNMLKNKPVIQTYLWDKLDVTAEYMKSYNDRPFEIKPNLRIFIEPSGANNFTSNQDQDKKGVMDWIKGLF